MKLVTTKFNKCEKHVVATWNFGNYFSICFSAQGNQEKPVSRWPVAGPSEYWLVASSPAFKVKKKKQYTHSTTNTHMLTTHTSQLRQYTQSTKPFRYMFIVPVSNLYPMFTYRPVDVTSHLIASISVFRWCNILHVLPLAASLCSSDHDVYWVLDLGLLLLNSQFLPLGLSYITLPGILASLSLLSSFCRVFTIIYLQQTLFLGCIVLQVSCIYNLCYT